MDNTRRRRRKQHKVTLHDSEGLSLTPIYLFSTSNFTCLRIFSMGRTVEARNMNTFALFNAFWASVRQCSEMWPGDLF